MWSEMPGLAMAVWDAWLPVFWILWLLWSYQLWVWGFAMNLECSTKKLKAVSRRNIPMNGSASQIRGNLHAQQVLCRFNLAGTLRAISKTAKLSTTGTLPKAWKQCPTTPLSQDIKKIR